MAEGEDQSSEEQQNWSGKQGNELPDLDFDFDFLETFLNIGDGQFPEDFLLAVAEDGGSSETVIPVADQNAIVAGPLAETQVNQHQLQTTENPIHGSGSGEVADQNEIVGVPLGETYVTQDQHQLTAVSNVQRKRCIKFTRDWQCEEHAVAGAKYCISHLQAREDKIRMAKAYISSMYGDNVRGKRCLTTGPSGQCKEDAVQVKATAEDVPGMWKFEIDPTIDLHEMIRLTAKKTRLQEGSFTMLYQDFENDYIRLETEKNLIEAIEIAKSGSNILYLHLVLDKK